MPQPDGGVFARRMGVMGVGMVVEVEGRRLVSVRMQEI